MSLVCERTKVLVRFGAGTLFQQVPLGDELELVLYMMAVAQLWAHATFVSWVPESANCVDWHVSAVAVSACD